MFSLTKESLRLAHINLREEHHGDDKVIAVDLKLEFETSNAVLLKFSPTLRDAFYTQDPGATQDLINPDHAPKLRNPEIGEIRWALEIPHARFSVFADGSNDEEIVFSGAKCGKFKFTLKEGGTTIVTFLIQQSEPLEMDVTKLAFLMGKQIKVSLEAEEEPEYEGGDEDGDHPGNVVSLFDQLDSDDDESEELQNEPSDGFETKSSEDAEPIGDDPLYQQAAAFVRGRASISISSLKRELKIEANVASRLLDKMESEGIVDEPAGNGVREVFAVPAASGA
jgi:ribosomal protein S25